MALAGLCGLLVLFILADQVWDGGRAVLMWAAIGYGSLGLLWLYALIHGRERTPFQFLIVLAFMSIVWVFLNWPQSGGSLKEFLIWAGCPWRFAFWTGSLLVRIDGLALTTNIGLFVDAIPALWVCVKSKLKSLPRDPEHDGVEH